jgi:hypothetical protein
VLSRNILVESNDFVANSNVGRDREHHSYIEAAGVVYQYNRYRNTRPGSLGGALKDRSAGTVVRYNWIEDGARALDLVDAEDSVVLIGGLPEYRSTCVYGNVINLRGEDSAITVHYGGDSGVLESYRKGTLYFYHNTVVYRVDRSARYHSTVFSLDTNDETARIWNNVFHLQSETPGADATFLFMAQRPGRSPLRRQSRQPGHRRRPRPGRLGRAFRRHDHGLEPAHRVPRQRSGLHESRDRRLQAARIVRRGGCRHAAAGHHPCQPPGHVAVPASPRGHIQARQWRGRGPGGIRGALTF